MRVANERIGNVVAASMVGVGPSGEIQAALSLNQGFCGAETSLLQPAIKPEGSVEMNFSLATESLV